MGGLQVTLLDRQLVGQESSWAGGGIVSPLYPWRYSAAVTALAHWSQGFYPGLGERLLASTGIDPEVYVTGLYWLDLPDEAEALAWAEREERGLLAVDVAQVREHVSALGDGFTRALHMPGVANVRNPRLVQALRAELERLPNVRLVEHCTVHGFLRDDGRICGVETSDGLIEADQVVLTARQVFERYVPTQDPTEQLLTQLVQESHLMIRLTAMAFEEEPHSTIGAFVVNPDRSAYIVHVGDTRVYHFDGPELVHRTIDHSFVQRLVDEGQITEEEANVHPQSNLLTACLGAQTEPPLELHRIDHLALGDTLMVCSDGLWHYFTPKELGAIVHTLPPREAAEMLVTKARHRARGGGDNLSVALVRVESLS